MHSFQQMHRLCLTQIPTQRKQASGITCPKSSHSSLLTETIDQEATETPEKEFKIPRGAMFNCTNDVVSTTLSFEEDGLWCSLHRLCVCNAPSKTPGLSASI